MSLGKILYICIKDQHFLLQDKYAGKIDTCMVHRDKIIRIKARNIIDN